VEIVHFSAFRNKYHTDAVLPKKGYQHAKPTNVSSEIPNRRIFLDTNKHLAFPFCTHQQILE